MTFETYCELGQHKSQVHQKKLLSLTPKIRSQDSQQSPLPPPIKDDPDSNKDFLECVSNAIDAVPETTFNNMHGTISHIPSTDGQFFQSKQGKLGAVEKVKLNVSDTWTRKNVWESGWEQTKNR